MSKARSLSCEDAWKKLKASNAKSQAKSKGDKKRKRKLQRQKVCLAKKLLEVDPFVIEIGEM